MKLSSILSSVFAVVLCASGVVLAQESKMATGTAGSYAAEVTASKLHLRAGPTAQYQSVVIVEKGRKLLVRGAATGGWAKVELPGGFEAWVGAEFLTVSKEGTGTVTANRLLVRPRPSTRYHQLTGWLTKGETVRVLEEKIEGDTKWLRIHAPQRLPLFCSSKFITKIGPASLAVAPAAKSAAAAGSAAKSANADARFIVIEKQVRGLLSNAKSARDLQPIRRALAEVDGGKLSLDNQRRHIALERRLLAKRDELVISDVELAQKGMLADIEKEIAHAGLPDDRGRQAALFSHCARLRPAPVPR